MTHPSLRLAFWLLLLGLLLGALRLWQGEFYLQNNLLALLPDTQESKATRLASEQLGTQLGDEFVFFLGTASPPDLITASSWLSDNIEQSPFLDIIDPYEQIDGQMAYIEELKEHSPYLLTDQQFQQLKLDGGQAILHGATAAAYDPSAWGAVTSLTEDPLGLLSHYITSAAGETPAITTLGDLILISSPELSYSVFRGRVTPGAFDLDAQAAMATLENELANFLDNQPVDFTVVRAGAIFHAARAAATAKEEMTLIGIGTSLGIVLLFLFCFRSLKPLLLSLSSVAFGCIAALIICWNFYGSLHLLTLVFGASLIGVSVDYSLHYLTRTNLASNLLPALGLALVTSIVGYGSLLQAPLPGLQEMAMFSITGLLATALFVIVLFPLLHRHAIHPPPESILSLARLPLHFWKKRSTLKISGIALLVLMGLSQLKTGNDIRVFHVPDPQLLREQHLIEQLLPGHAPNQFFLIRAKTEEALLQRAERFKPSLERLAKTNSISGYTLISDTLPSLNRQQQNRKLLSDTVYRQGGEAEIFFSDMGFDKQVRERFIARLRSMTPLTPREWLEVAPQNLQLTWLGNQDGYFYSIVLLESVQNTAELRALATNEQGVDFVDTVDAISANLEARMHSATHLLLIAYVAIGSLLMLRYRTLSSLRLLGVPLASSVLTLALLSTCGIPINLFHIFALFLILGLGMDYGVFLRESGAQSSSCLLAIMLSALTSSLSFGLLALSSTPMISAFGTTILIGGMCNWLLAPLAADD